MKITAKSTIKITIDGKEFEIDKSIATELYLALKKELDIKESKCPDYYPPMRPYIPRDNDRNKHPNTPMPWTFPTDPTHPSYPQVWCQNQSSTCNS